MIRFLHFLLFLFIYYSRAVNQLDNQHDNLLHGPPAALPTPPGNLHVNLRDSPQGATSYQSTLSIHPINKSYQPTLSIHHSLHVLVSPLSSLTPSIILRSSFPSTRTPAVNLHDSHPRNHQQHQQIFDLPSVQP